MESNQQPRVCDPSHLIQTPWESSQKTNAMNTLVVESEKMKATIDTLIEELKVNAERRIDALKASGDRIKAAVEKELEALNANSDKAKAELGKEMDALQIDLKRQFAHTKDLVSKEVDFFEECFDDMAQRAAQHEAERKDGADRESSLEQKLLLSERGKRELEERCRRLEAQLLEAQAGNGADKQASGEAIRVSEEQSKVPALRRTHSSFSQTPRGEQSSHAHPSKDERKIDLMFSEEIVDDDLTAPQALRLARGGVFRTHASHQAEQKSDAAKSTLSATSSSSSKLTHNSASRSSSSKDNHNRKRRRVGPVASGAIGALAGHAKPPTRVHGHRDTPRELVRGSKSVSVSEASVLSAPGPVGLSHLGGYGAHRLRAHDARSLAPAVCGPLAKRANSSSRSEVKMRDSGSPSDPQQRVGCSRSGSSSSKSTALAKRRTSRPKSATLPSRCPPESRAVRADGSIGPNVAPYEHVCGENVVATSSQSLYSEEKHSVITEQPEISASSSSVPSHPTQTGAASTPSSSSVPSSHIQTSSVSSDNTDDDAESSDANELGGVVRQLPSHMREIFFSPELEDVDSTLWSHGDKFSCLKAVLQLEKDRRNKWYSLAKVYGRGLALDIEQMLYTIHTTNGRFSREKYTERCRILRSVWFDNVPLANRVKSGEHPLGKFVNSTTNELAPGEVQEFRAKAQSQRRSETVLEEGFIERAQRQAIERRLMDTGNDAHGQSRNLGSTARYGSALEVITAASEATTVISRNSISALRAEIQAALWRGAAGMSSSTHPGRQSFIGRLTGR